MNLDKAFFFATLLFAPALLAQKAELVQILAKSTTTTVELPGEVLPYESVTLHAKLASFVDRVLVDRGSKVKKGDLLVQLSAPEIQAQIAGAESKVASAKADEEQAQAQLTAAQSTYERTKKAAETPGAIAGNELLLSEKQVEGAEALLSSRQQASKAAEAGLRSLRDLVSYLQIRAPFAGIVTERGVHPGALVGPGNNVGLLEVQEISRLRLVVALPEQDVSGISSGASVMFRVPAWPGRAFSGTIARVSRSLDAKTRTMPVELDVANHDGALAPGMYATVKWPIRRQNPGLFVPKTSVVTTTERTFVIKNKGGVAQWVDVKKGVVEGDLVEVMGNVHSGDTIVRRANDEIKDGVSLSK